jgi:N-acetyl-anhydromuramyl-L-alanine amidase AmpD
VAGEGAAYQYFIDKKGIVWRMRQDHWNGGHVKGSLNRNSIGICCEGNYETETEMPTAQLTSLVQLVSFKMAEYNIPIDKVTPHKYHADTSCPGKNFPWIDFKSMTFNPIKQFQEEYGLKVDGIVGKRTIAKVLKLIQIIHTAREALKGERDGFNGSNEVHK